ncbi:MAG: hypothetical protein DSM106950_44650 [Stigonema ocellatum SAG 48.90 = DSM 106950]|nr:hypothetical protein [Stigonema ocellatum SAG 48.90 = DSM 106950]
MELITIPDLSYPFPTSINKNAEYAKIHLLQWVNHFNLATESTAHKVLEIRCDLLAAYTYPNASKTSLEIITDYFAWIFIYDDKIEEMAIQGQLDSLYQLNTRLIGIIRGVNPVKEDEPLIHSFANICQRLKRYGSVNFYNRFIKDYEDYLYASAWEAKNSYAQIKPNLATYLKMRPYIGGIYPFLDLTELIEGIDLVEEYVGHPIIQALRLTTGNILLWANDIISCQKEYKIGQYHNIVIILYLTRNCTFDEAIQQAKEIHDAEVESFCELVSQLPSFNLSVDAEMQRYIAGFQSWMRGHHDWWLISGRYKTFTTNHNS